MAGSISIAGAQQFDVLGNLLGGGKIYWIQAGTTSTPQNAYYDTSLTLPLPNPYELQADARVPFHYLADGQIKIRIVDSNGVTRFEQDNILVIGPSSGSGGGGGVDPTTVFQTGWVMWLDLNEEIPGFVRDNGRTIGNAISGATERANSDTQALWVWCYNKFSNTICPVSGGRTGNAANDYAANKTLQLPDKRGYVHGGLDDMGNSAASRYSGVPVVSGGVTTAGSVIGEVTHTLSIAELPTVTPAGTIGGSASYNGTVDSGVGGSFGPNYIITNKSTQTINGSNFSFTGTPFGSGSTHNTVQKTVLGTFYRKL